MKSCRNNSAFLSIAACAAGTLIAGCGSSGSSSQAMPGRDGRTTTEDGRAAPLAGGRAYQDPIARATLRERAITLLSSAATNGQPEERANAIEGLAATPTRLAPIIDQLLADPNIGVRSVAAMVAGRAKMVSTVPSLRRLLDDSSPQVRASAMYALNRCGEPVNITPIATMLLDPSPRLRAYAAFLLGELGEPSANAMLRDAGRRNVSKSDAAEVRIMDLQLAEARVKLGDETTLPEIRAALFPAKPEDLEATALACQIIGGIRDAASTNRLIELVRPIDDKKQVMPAEVRLSAASALAKLGQRHGAYIADQFRANKREVLRAQAAMVYGEIGENENLPLLADMMNDSVGRVRVAAAAGIMKITEGNTEGMTHADP